MTMQMNTEGIMLSLISHKDKYYYDHTYIWNLKKLNSYKQRIDW